MDTNQIIPSAPENSLQNVTQILLADVHSALDNTEVMSVPIAELSSLGAGVSSLIPALNTVTTTTTLSADGLFRIANQATGDVLKMAKNGNAYGAMKTATGGSKLVQLTTADSLTATSQAVSAINPATMMMAVALYSIEKQLGEISEMQKKILSFLETKDEAAAEADLETLTELINNYKYNWNNKVYVQSSHKMVIDIKRASRCSMLTHQKRIENTVSATKIMVAQSKVKSTSADLEQQFKYYRLSLYTYSLASMMEVLLGENYCEEYISNVKCEIESLSSIYRTLFEKSSYYLEKLGAVSLETNIIKGFGIAGDAVGKFIGGVPLIKEGPVDEFLQEHGAHLKKDAQDMEKEAIYRFASLSNPGTRVFIDKMEDMIRIYNHTNQVCFDNKCIYLVSEKTA